MTGLLALLLVAVLIVIPAVVMRWTNAAHRRARSHHRALDALGHITSSAPAGRVETTRTTVPFGSTAPPGGKADLDGNPRLATDHLGSQAYVRVVSSDSPAPLPAPRPLTGGWRPTRATGAAPFRRPGVSPETAGFEQPEALPGQLSGRDGVEHVRAFRDGEDPSVGEPDPDEADADPVDLEEAGAQPVQAASLEGPAVRVLLPEGASGDDDPDEAATGPVPAVGQDGEADDGELDEEEDDWPIEPAATAEVRILDTAAPLDAPAWEPPQSEQDEPQPAPAVPMSRLVIPAFPEEDPTLEHVVVLGAAPDAPGTPAGPPASGAVAAESGLAPLTVALPDTSDSPTGTGNGAGHGPGEPPTHPIPQVSEVDPAPAESDNTDTRRAPGTPLVTTTAAAPSPPNRPSPPAGAHTARPGTGPSHRRPRTPGRHRARNLATAAVILVLVAAAALVANRELLNRHPTAPPDRKS